MSLDALHQVSAEVWVDLEGGVMDALDAVTARIRSIASPAHRAAIVSATIGLVSVTLLFGWAPGAHRESVPYANAIGVAHIETQSVLLEDRAATVRATNGSMAAIATHASRHAPTPTGPESDLFIAQHRLALLLSQREETGDVTEDEIGRVEVDVRDAQRRLVEAISARARNSTDVILRDALGAIDGTESIQEALARASANGDRATRMLAAASRAARRQPKG